ncbi:MAG TPA: hypothetical protein VM347_34110 [Nonomuraea sp.]|nr:hypothetical protein [Nonomuraea sp.]
MIVNRRFLRRHKSLPHAPGVRHRGEGPARLDAGEGEAVAALLDELAALYSGERLGRLAQELAVRLYDRMGL